MIRIFGNVNIIYFELLRRGYDLTIGKPDNYGKIVIAMEYNLPQDQDGIRITGAVDFLLCE